VKTISPIVAYESLDVEDFDQRDPRGPIGPADDGRVRARVQSHEHRQFQGITWREPAGRNRRSLGGGLPVVIKGYARLAGKQRQGRVRQSARHARRCEAGAGGSDQHRPGAALDDKTPNHHPIPGLDKPPRGQVDQFPTSR